MVFMQKAEKFLEQNYQRLRQVKLSDKCEVWSALSRQGGEFVIIKVVNSTGLPYATLKNFQFKLPAKIIYCAEEDGKTFIVEEFIEGRSLLERIEQKNFLSESEAEKILLQMCDGLKELHEQKIIHRDIKPSNMILQADGRIRLIDFDAARIFKDNKATDTELLGTKGYAPPEQYGFGQTDPRSDIYSLGVTIKNLLSKSYGGRLKKILDKCTAYDPAQRFQSADELRRKILAAKYLSVAKKIAALAAIVLGVSSIINLSAVEAPIDFNSPRADFQGAIGGLKFGDSIETMRKIFGSAKEIRVSEDLPDTFFYEYADVVITVKDNFVVGIATYTAAVADGKGIRQGDSLDKVLAAYGAGGWQIETDDGTIFYEYPFKSERETFVMRFAVKNDVVEYISLRIDDDRD